MLVGNEMKFYTQQDIDDMLKEIKRAIKQRRAEAEAQAETEKSKPSEAKTRKRRRNKQYVSPDKRRRDSLMANNRMRYVISRQTNTVFDRNCPQVASIPDNEFDMLETIPWHAKMCPCCYKRMIVRTGLSPDQAKYIDTALGVLDALNAPIESIHSLFIINAARIEKVEPDAIHIKVRDDTWKMQVSSGHCLLYHNNYVKIGDNDRYIYKGIYHLQVPYAIPFSFAASMMCTYEYGMHWRDVAQEGA